MKRATKELFGVLAVSLLGATVLTADTNELSLIPLPQKVQRFVGEFALTAEVNLYTDAASLQTAKQLAAELHPATGYPLTVRRTLEADRAMPGSILLTTKGADTNLGPEGYELTVTTNTVVIRAPAQAGLFYGMQTLMQLLPPEIYSTQVVAKASWQMPCVRITDWPRFKWRGLMLDVSRHFYSTAEVETLLDLMARYKLNRFHWHLTDDQGWRIEIKKYPRLTQVGAWRKHSALAVPPSHETNAHPAWAAPTADKFGPDGHYGGFYTPKDIREVVAYAAARHIMVVPEIEMPGHSLAALAAYPQFGCFDGSDSREAFFDIHGIERPAKRGVYDPANPGTFKFLDGVLAGVFKLFPGQYVHIGGDEVRKIYWANSPDCQALMKREGLTNEDELQSWFIQRIEKFVHAHGRTMIGWSEIMKGGLASNAVVMDWIGGGKEAASAGHDVVMTPRPFCYLNLYQSQNHATEPRANGSFVPLERVYSFEPVPTGLPAVFQPHVLGAQANLWTEYIASLPHAEYMLFPRLCAMAEVVWSPQTARNWPDFQRRLKADEQRLGELGVNYYRGPSGEVTNH
jgi:hexosaminidase